MTLVGEPGGGPATGGPGTGILHDGRLAGQDVEQLAARVGTPFYAYDLDAVARQVTALRAVLPATFDVAYAVKANPNLAVLGHLAGLGIGADVASGGELRHVLRAGFAAGGIVFTGPGKRDEELRAAVEAGVRVVTLESRGEIGRLAGLAAAAGRCQPVLLRAAVAGASRAEPVRIIGDRGAGKFGMGWDDLVTAAREAVASPWLEPVGLHAFGASNVVDAATLATHAGATIDAAMELAATTGFELRLVDVGGGLGVPYAAGGTALDLAELGAGLAPLADRLSASPVGRVARVLLEPGRFLVAAAGAYVARVVDRKASDGRPVVILDGGIHHVLRPALVGQEHRVVVLTGHAAGARPGPADGAGVTVAGPLCSGLDVLAHAAPIVSPEVGDLVAILDVGAYGATESMPFFLSHPLPAEVAIRGGVAWVSRPRVEPEAWLGWQVGEPPV